MTDYMQYQSPKVSVSSVSINSDQSFTSDAQPNIPFVFRKDLTYLNHNVNTSLVGSRDPEDVIDIICDIEGAIFILCSFKHFDEKSKGDIIKREWVEAELFDP